MPGTPGVNGCALSCLVVNVNGMRSRNKRRGLFQRLRDLRYSIVVLCETHSKDDRETTRWAQEGAGPGLPWEGQAFWSHGTSSSRGMAILVRPGLAIVAQKAGTWPNRTTRYQPTLFFYQPTLARPAEDAGTCKPPTTRPPPS